MLDVARLAGEAVHDVPAEPDAFGEAPEAVHRLGVAGEHQHGPPAQRLHVVVRLAAEFPIGNLAFVDPVMRDLPQPPQRLELRRGPGRRGRRGGEAVRRVRRGKLLPGVHGDEAVLGVAGAERREILLQREAVRLEMLLLPDPVKQPGPQPVRAVAQREGGAVRVFHQRIEEAERNLVAHEHAAARLHRHPVPAGHPVPVFRLAEEVELRLPVRGKGGQGGVRGVLAEFGAQAIQRVPRRVGADLRQLAGEPAGAVGLAPTHWQEMDREEPGPVGGMGEAEVGRSRAGLDDSLRHAIAVDGRFRRFGFEAKDPRTVRDAPIADPEGDPVGVEVTVVQIHQDGPAPRGEVEPERVILPGDAVCQREGAHAAPVGVGKRRRRRRGPAVTASGVVAVARPQHDGVAAGARGVARVEVDGRCERAGGAGRTRDDGGQQRDWSTKGFRCGPT